MSETDLEALILACSAAGIAVNPKVPPTLREVQQLHDANVLSLERARRLKLSKNIEKMEQKLEVLSRLMGLLSLAENIHTEQELKALLADPWLSQIELSKDNVFQLLDDTASSVPDAETDEDRKELQEKQDLLRKAAELWRLEIPPRFQCSKPLKPQAAIGSLAIGAPLNPASALHPVSVMPTPTSRPSLRSEPPSPAFSVSSAPAREDIVQKDRLNADWAILIKEAASVRQFPHSAERSVHLLRILVDIIITDRLLAQLQPPNSASQSPTLEILEELKRLDQLIDTGNHRALGELKKAKSCFYEGHFNDKQISDCKRALDNLGKIIQPFNVALFLRYVEEAERVSLSKLDQKHVFLVLSRTGAGKSTTIHYLSNSVMGWRSVWVDDQGELKEKRNYEALAVASGVDGLGDVRTGQNAARSETRFVVRVELPREWRDIDELLAGKVILVDTPGFGDTSGPELDVANGISIVLAISKCASVRPIIISNYRLWDKGRALEHLVDCLEGMIPNLGIYASSFSFVHANCPTDRLRNIPFEIDDLMKRVRDQRGESSAAYIFLERMKSDASNSDTFIALYPELMEAHKDSQWLLRKLASKSSIPAHVFQIFVSSSSMGHVKLQLSIDKENISRAMKQHRFDFVLHKLKQIQALMRRLPRREIWDSLDVCIHTVHESLKIALDEVEARLRPDLDLQDEDSKFCKEKARYIDDACTVLGSMLLTDALGAEFSYTSAFGSVLVGVGVVQRKIFSFINSLKDEIKLAEVVDPFSVVTIDRRISIVNVLASEFKDDDIQKLKSDLCAKLAQDYASLVSAVRLSIQGGKVEAFMTQLSVLLAVAKCASLKPLTRETSGESLKQEFVHHIDKQIDAIKPVENYCQDLPKLKAVIDLVLEVERVQAVPQPAMSDCKESLKQAFMDFFVQVTESMETLAEPRRLRILHDKVGKLRQIPWVHNTCAPRYVTVLHKLQHKVTLAREKLLQDFPILVHPDTTTTEIADRRVTIMNSIATLAKFRWVETVVEDEMPVIEHETNLENFLDSKSQEDGGEAIRSVFGQIETRVIDYVNRQLNKVQKLGIEVVDQRGLQAAHALLERLKELKPIFKTPLAEMLHVVAKLDAAAMVILKGVNSVLNTLKETFNLQHYSRASFLKLLGDLSVLFSEYQCAHPALIYLRQETKFEEPQQLKNAVKTAQAGLQRFKAEFPQNQALNTDAKAQAFSPPAEARKVELAELHDKMDAKLDENPAFLDLRKTEQTLGAVLLKYQSLAPEDEFASNGARNAILMRVQSLAPSVMSGAKLKSTIASMKATEKEITGFDYIFREPLNLSEMNRSYSFAVLSAQLPIVEPESIQDMTPKMGDFICKYVAFVKQRLDISLTELLAALCEGDGVEEFPKSDHDFSSADERKSPRTLPVSDLIVCARNLYCWLESLRANSEDAISHIVRLAFTDSRGYADYFKVKKAATERLRLGLESALDRAGKKHAYNTLLDLSRLFNALTRLDETWGGDAFGKLVLKTRQHIAQAQEQAPVLRQLILENKFEELGSRLKHLASNQLGELKNDLRQQIENLNGSFRQEWNALTSATFNLSQVKQILQIAAYVLTVDRVKDLQQLLLPVTQQTIARLKAELQKLLELKLSELLEHSGQRLCGRIQCLKDLSATCTFLQSCEFWTEEQCVAFQDRVKRFRAGMLAALAQQSERLKSSTVLSRLIDMETDLSFLLKNVDEMEAGMKQDTEWTKLYTTAADTFRTCVNEALKVILQSEGTFEFQLQQLTRFSELVGRLLSFTARDSELSRFLMQKKTIVDSKSAEVRTEQQSCDLEISNYFDTSKNLVLLSEAKQALQAYEKDKLFCHSKELKARITRSLSVFIGDADFTLATCEFAALDHTGFFQSSLRHILGNLLILCPLSTPRAEIPLRADDVFSRAVRLLKRYVDMVTEAYDFASAVLQRGDQLSESDVHLLKSAVNQKNLNTFRDVETQLGPFAPDVTWPTEKIKRFCKELHCYFHTLHERFSQATSKRASMPDATAVSVLLKTLADCELLFKEAQNTYQLGSFTLKKYLDSCITAGTDTVTKWSSSPSSTASFAVVFSNEFSYKSLCKSATRCADAFKRSILESKVICNSKVERRTTESERRIHYEGLRAKLDAIEALTSANIADMIDSKIEQFPATIISSFKEQLREAAASVDLIMKGSTIRDEMYDLVANTYSSMLAIKDGHLPQLTQAAQESVTAVINSISRRWTNAVHMAAEIVIKPVSATTMRQFANHLNSAKQIGMNLNFMKTEVDHGINRCLFMYKSQAENLKLEELEKIFKETDDGKAVYEQASFFKFARIREMNEETINYGIDYVLKHIGDAAASAIAPAAPAMSPAASATVATAAAAATVAVIGAAAAASSVAAGLTPAAAPSSRPASPHGFIDLQALRIAHNSCEEAYNDVLKRFTNQPSYKEVEAALPTLVSDICASCERLSINAWNQRVSDAIPNIMGRIFAFWTLKNAEHFFDYASVLESRPKELFYWKPKASQIVTILRMLGIGYTNQKGTLFNNLVQLGTGCGKSVCLAVACTVLVLLGGEVSIACYSAELSERDFQDFEPLFDAFFGNNAKRVIHYGTFEQLCERVINVDAPSGDLRKAVSQLIVSGVFEPGAKPASAAQSASASKTSFRLRDALTPILLIDEVDVFFKADFYGNDYLPAAQIYDSKHLIRDLARYIWSQKDAQPRLLFNKLIQRPEYTSLQAHFSAWPGIVHSAAKSMLSAVSQYKNPAFSIQNRRIVYDMHGDIAPGLSFTYRTMFAYHEKQFDVSPEAFEKNVCLYVECGQFSYAEVPHCFKYILGVSGTLPNADRGTGIQVEIMRNMYDVSIFTLVPSVYGVKTSGDSKISSESATVGRLVEKPTLYINGDKKEDLFFAVVARAQDVRKAKQAALVFFESLQLLNECYDFAISHSALNIHRLTEKVDRGDRRTYIDQATRSGAITFCTRYYGRGIDFHCRDSKVIAAGGVEVIHTFISNDPSEDVQIKGRSARQSNPGVYGQILLEADVLNLGVTAAEFKADTSEAGRRQLIETKRNAKFATSYENVNSKIGQLREIHQKSMDFVRQLRNRELAKAADFLKARSEMANFGGSEERSRTLILIDGTGSMGMCLSHTRNSVHEMFNRILKVAQEEKANMEGNEVGIGIYRNYDSSASDLFEFSGFDNRPEALQNFMKLITHKGGRSTSTGGEAVEIALFHANQLFDQEPMEHFQIILIGDAPPNTDENVRKLRKQGILGEVYWIAHAPYNKPVFWQKQLDALEQKGVVRHAFYLHPTAEADFKRIAGVPENCRSLDVNSADGAEFLTSYILQEVMGLAGKAQGLGDNLKLRYKRSYPKAFL